MHGISINLSDDRQRAIERSWRQPGSVGSVETQVEVVGAGNSSASVQVGTLSWRLRSWSRSACGTQNGLPLALVWAATWMDRDQAGGDPGYWIATFMFSHALTIIVNELETHLVNTYGSATVTPQVRLGNVAEGLGGGAANAGAVPRDILDFSMVNIREEKSLKNVSNHVRNDVMLRVSYENPPVFLNLHILIVATHTNYANALLMLSRAIRFFQSKNVFDQDSVAPASVTLNAPPNQLDQLETFKLILDLYSPTMEEVNHLWGTLGGKQYPFVLYTLRLVALKFKAVQAESGLITEVVNDFHHKNSQVI